MALKTIQIECPEELEELIISLVNDLIKLENILQRLDKYPERKLKNMEELIYYGKMFD